MSRAAEESKLASWLCSEMLGANELRALARARGFPPPAGAKNQLAASVAVRLLEPIGVAEAMAQLDATWLAVLHLLAAAQDAVPLLDLASALDPNRDRYSVDARRLWRLAAEGLLTKGVALADEAALPPRYEKSRFARLRLLVPADFRRFLPPFPLASLPTRTPGETGRLTDVLRAAFAAFLSRPPVAKAPTPTDLAGRLAAHFKLDDGQLSLAGAARPTPELALRHAAVCWEAGLEHGGRFAAPVPAGSMAHHILAHLPADHACTPKALAKGLAGLGIQVPPASVADFCAQGTAAGLLLRYPVSNGEALFAAAKQPLAPPANDEALALAPHRGGVRLNVKDSAVLAVLRAATVARATIDDGEMLLEPDPVRLGRAWDDADTVRTATALGAVSPAFASAARQVAERHGQVVVHQGLTVLRIADVGLLALLRTRFPTDVRELGHRHLAVVRERVDDVLAAARKEGFTPRRAT
ncbi:MAG: hypothetical protein HY905_12510 [Deltaproteobacteria bacterium]|nr:hypothetical protein [Deltaproteobacteria bacterium]